MNQNLGFKGWKGNVEGPKLNSQWCGICVLIVLTDKNKFR